MRIDLHTHSSVSDGTDTPAGLVAQAVTAGLDVVALTDHDTFDGLPEALAAGGRLGVEVLRGIEISAQRRGASVHLLGYGCRVDDRALSAELARVREGRSGRVGAMLARLSALGMPIPADVLYRQVGDGGEASTCRRTCSRTLPEAAWTASRSTTRTTTRPPATNCGALPAS